MVRAERSMRWIAGRGAMLVAAAMLAGCASVRDFVRPTVRVPEAFSTPSVGVVSDWWRSLDDPLLAELVQQAQDSNPSVQAALQRLRQARALEQVAGARSYPTVNGNASGARAQVAPASPVTPLTDTFKAGFDASWEVDLWGGIRQQQAAARAGALSSAADLADVRLALVSEVAVQYVNLRVAQGNADYTRQTLASREETRDIVRQRVAIGLANGDDLTRAESQFQLASASLAQTLQTADTARLSLELLCGLQPGELLPRLTPTTELLSFPVPGGVLPPELLQRRPDVRRDEQLAAQALANVGVARANRLPKFVFSGAVGASRVFPTTPWFLPFSIATSLSGVVFDAGALAAQIEQKDAQSAEAVWRYVATVRNAVSEVEQRLVAIQRGNERVAALDRQVTADRETLSIARERYRRGLTGFLDVADAERVLFATELALNQARGTLAADTISLNKALGGEWPSGAEQTP